MQIKFYGVRGSIASPGADTVYYGGNTACVRVESDDSLFIFDAGTGIRKLGEELIKLPDIKNLHLLFSHYHWDHIQGFPFFLPAYKKDQLIYLLAAHLDEVNAHSVLTQMTDPHFPVPSDKLEARVEVLNVKDSYLDIGATKIKTCSLNHPGGGSAYILESSQGSMAYVTDNELYPPDKPRTTYEEWVTFLTDVDFLIHDAMYLDEQRESIHGWGHSLVSQTLQLAVDAKVRNLVLFHHDPSRTDKQLDQIKNDSREWMKQHSPDCNVYIAREGEEYAIQNSVVTRL